MSAPPVVNIQVARTCNLRCSFCSHDVWREPTGMMTWETFTLAIARMKEDCCTTLCFVSAQGEALLHPRILEMLEVSLDAGFETNLVTNGTPLTERRIARLAALNLHGIQVSFAGWDKASYERLYVGARFEQVSENLRQLIAALQGARTSLTINGIVDDSDGLGKTVGYLMSLGASRAHIRIALPHNWGGTVRAGAWQGGIYSHREIDRRTFKVCPLLKSTQGIYIDGRVTACGCIDANGALEIGHLAESGIAAMRAGERYRAMIDAFERKDVAHLPLCGTCEIPFGGGA